jgi:hypothetical protein
MLSFKIKAYSFESLMHEPLACENINVSAFYNVPTDKTSTRLPITTGCNEINGALNYTIVLKHTPGEQELYIENSQYISLDATYNGNGFIVNDTKLYFLYSGRNYYFTGKENLQLWFTSLELEFGSFYKTQLAPFFTKQPYNLWPWT